MIIQYLNGMTQLLILRLYLNIDSFTLRCNQK